MTPHRDGFVVLGSVRFRPSGHATDEDEAEDGQ